MSAIGLPLGWDHNLIYEASGVHIPMAGLDGVMFYNFLDAGTQTVTIVESNGDGVNEANLVVIDTIWKTPNAGGTWTKVTQSVLATYNHATDAVNDVIGIYVSADSMSDGLTYLEMTSGTGTCVAVLVGLASQRGPANLATNI